MTPNGEQYWPNIVFMEDFSIMGIGVQRWFMHESVHVWQYQMGMFVKAEGLFSWAVSYQYVLEEDKVLSDYGMEKQACIIADYFVLTRYGFAEWENQPRMRKAPKPDDQLGEQSLIALYQKVLALFLKNPKDREVLFPCCPL